VAVVSLKKADAAIASFDIGGACVAGANFVKLIDQFISQWVPFKLAKDPKNLPVVGDLLRECAEGVRISSLLLSPAMPEKMADLWKRWNCTPPPGVPLADLCQWGGPYSLQPGTPIEKGDALFMRADPAELPPGA
jgi:methionyl-tRNA synthetase